MMRRSCARYSVRYALRRACRDVMLCYFARAFTQHACFARRYLIFRASRAARYAYAAVRR